jgi:hypothetical protein
MCRSFQESTGFLIPDIVPKKKTYKALIFSGLFTTTKKICRNHPIRWNVLCLRNEKENFGMEAITHAITRHTYTKMILRKNEHGYNLLRNLSDILEY